MLYHQSNILEEEENSLEVLIKGRWSQKTQTVLIHYTVHDITHRVVCVCVREEK